MADRSAIEWTTATWNPTTGCDRISAGCDNCYALALAKRLKAMGQVKYQTDGDPRTSGPGFGVAVHEGDLNLLGPAEKKPFLVSTYRASLRRAGFRYVTSFEMIDDTGSDLHLVFGTSNRKGLEKMKDAMWNVDPVRGVHYRDPRDPGQLAFDFASSPDLTPLRRALLAELARGERTLAQLQDHALLETVYRGPHATKAAAGMLRGHLIEREPASGPVRKSTRFHITASGRLQLRNQPDPLF